jgi:DNA helicase IV
MSMSISKKHMSVAGTRLGQVSHPDLAAEQAYVDGAYDCLDRMREALIRAAEAGATEVAAEAIESWANERLRTFADAERGLCFGRIDSEEASEAIYVGRRWVHDDDRGALIVNWQAPAARPFYTATPAEPHGVTLRRRFRTRGRTLTGISDEALDGSLADAAAAVDDFLLEELEQARDARMRDIVATIQADQYRLIAREPDPPLVVQGGPGTGKTAVGLHRASYLLYAHRTELRRVLVVGPNPAFMEYVSHVLPTLGEESVDQRALAELVDGVAVTRADSLDVQRLKADPRLGEVVAQAAAQASEGGVPQELVIRLEGRFVGVESDEVGELLAEARAELGLTAAARGRFRMNVLRRFYEDYGVRLGGQAFRNFDEVERALRKDGRLTRFLDRAWPAPKPEQVVRRLLASREGLAAAADGLLDDAERELLRRARSGWSEADLPLIDETRALLTGAPTQYGHVIVDEAQDLTPMQLRMVERRAAGSFTVLGDIAQATGPIPYGRWEELLPHLPGGERAQVEELRHAYRVPREIMAIALPLLERIAPDVEPPLAYRVGAESPRIVRGDPPLEAGYEEAARLAGDEGLLAIIAPPSLRGTTAGSLFDESRIAVLTPREAKGMEFDHVIVVEPALIVEEAAEGQGLRELYVALTRPTTTLVLVHARPLPPELGL